MSAAGAREPLVTVGLPVYNGERFVAKSIETLLAQTFRDFKIVISDNASTDRTGEICREFASRDPRIEYHRNQTNIGMAGNYNLTFGLSRSKYFRWATADDFCAPELLADHVRVLEGDDSIALCYPQAWFVDEDGTPYEPWKDELHLMQDDPTQRFKTVVKQIRRVHHHLGLMRADCVRRTGGIAKHVSSDVGFIAEMSLLGKLYQLEKQQYFRRLHVDSSSWAHRDEKHQARRYHASNVRRVPFSRTRYHWRLLEAVRRSPLSSREHRALYSFLLRYAVSDRRRLARDWWWELQRVLGSSPPA